MAEPEAHSAHEINQILRGHNYFYADYLMTHKFPIKDGIDMALTYFEMNVQYLVQYLKNIDEHFNEVYVLAYLVFQSD